MPQYEVWAKPAYEDTPEMYWAGEAETTSDAISLAKVEGHSLRPDLIDWEAVIVEEQQENGVVYCKSPKHETPCPIDCLACVDECWEYNGE